MARITYGDGKVLQPTSWKALKEDMKLRSPKRDAELVNRAEHKDENLPKVKVEIYAPLIKKFLAKRRDN